MVIPYAMLTGQQVQAQASELFSDDSLEPDAPSPGAVSAVLTWSSSDYTVAQFNQANYNRSRINILALKAGTATLTVTDGTLTTTISLTVTDPAAVTSVALDVQFGSPMPIVPVGTPSVP